MIDFDIIVHALRLNKVYTVFVSFQNGLQLTWWFLRCGICCLFLLRLLLRTADSYVVYDLDLALVNVHEVSREAIAT